MKQVTKNILAFAGIISAVVGIIGSVPSALQGKYGLAIASTFLLVGGLILLAIAFQD